MTDGFQRLYLRAHTVPADNKEEKDTRPVEDEPRWPEHALVFDCETRVSADLTLTFGFWRFCELRKGKYVCVEEGIFHDDELSAKEFDLLRKYARSTKPDTTDDGCDRLRLYSRTKFVDETLGFSIQAKVDVYFGPKPPQGKEGNWMPTDPARKFELLFRLYSPDKPFFDKQWKLPDVEETT